MLERKRADITIYSPTGAEIATVPITEECKRVKKLMEEDSITLSFTLDEALHVPIGSYVDDEIFGRFFITEEQIASFSERMGGYDHTLRFDAWYCLWALKQHMLTTTASSKRIRKEAQWTLTANLETHLREIYHNLLALDFVEKPTTVSYTGNYTNIFCPFLVEEDGKYSIRMYAKYAVDYDTFFEVDYSHVTHEGTEDEDTEDYQVCVYIPKGERISQWFDGDTFDYYTPDEAFEVLYYHLAAAVYPEEKKADIIKTDGNIAYKDYWNFFGARLDVSSYDGCTYTWYDNKAYTSKEDMKKIMGMGNGRITWKFPDEDGYGDTDIEKENKARIGDRAIYNEDFTAEEENFANYFVISADIENRLNALTISFSGTDIIAALKSIADTFECEYWIEASDTSAPYPTFKVHFGKCEYGDTPQVISCEDYTEDGEDKPLNTESMSLNKDTADNTNKFFVYGSEDNIPYSYRKSLIAKCVKIFTQGQKRCAYFQVEHILKGYKGFIDGNWFGHTAALPTLDISIPAQKKTLRSWRDGDTVEFEGTVGDRIYIPEGEYAVQGIESNGTVLDLLHNVIVGALVDSVEHYYYGDDDTDGYSGSCSFGFIREDLSEYVALVSNYQSGYYNRGQMYSAATAGMRYIGFNTNKYWTPRESAFYNKNRTIILKGGYYRLGTWGGMSDDFYTIKPSKLSDIEIKEGGLNLSFKGTDVGRSNITIEHNGKQYNATQNPFTKKKPTIVTDTDKEEMKYYCTEIPASMDIAVNGKVTFLGADSIDIPQHYFTTPYDDATSLYQIGARRLMLPENSNPDNSAYWDSEDNPQWICVNGAIVPYAYRGDLDNKSLVESTIAFDKVYPDGKMKVSKVIPEDMDYIEDATGDVEKYTWKWRQYHLHLVTADGGTLNFSEDYILDGYTLGIRFLPPTDLTNEQLEAEPKTDLKSGCKLAGMQFEDNFEDKRAPYKPSGFDKDIPTKDGESITDGTSTYTNADLLQDHIIARNDDFGAKLPNDVLYPQEGDPCCLINWDVRAIKRLGLIDAAEKRLMQKAFEYAQALKEGNFAFTCNMMSGFFFDLAGDYVQAFVSIYGNIPAFEGDGKALYEGDGKRIYVKSSEATHLQPMIDDDGKYMHVRNDYDVYAIPDIGQRVKVMHQGLAKGYKETRIIGYELKLDKPYDTPRLTCGETEAYSRVRQLEKEITKLNNR